MLSLSVVLCSRHRRPAVLACCGVLCVLWWCQVWCCVLWWCCLFHYMHFLVSFFLPDLVLRVLDPGLVVPSVVLCAVVLCVLICIYCRRCLLSCCAVVVPGVLVGAGWVLSILICIYIQLHPVVVPSVVLWFLYACCPCLPAVYGFLL